MKPVSFVARTLASASLKRTWQSLKICIGTTNWGEDRGIDRERERGRERWWGREGERRRGRKVGEGKSEREINWDWCIWHNLLSFSIFWCIISCTTEDFCGASNHSAPALIRALGRSKHSKVPSPWVFEAWRHYSNLFLITGGRIAQR